MLVKNIGGRDPLYKIIVFSRCNMKIFFGRFFHFSLFLLDFFVLSSEFNLFLLFHLFKLGKSYASSQNRIFDRERGVHAVKGIAFVISNLGSHMVRPKFKRLSIGVVSFLSFVKMSYQIIDQ